MTNEKLAQGVKILRKEKGFSQEELAKLSGLSLRTIQRIEKGETTPTGETLKRLSNALEVSTHELLEWNTTKDILIKTIQTKDAYLHVFNHKLILSKTITIDNLVEDYEKAVNHDFKTLMVFFIFIPIFSGLSVLLYTIDKTDLSFFSGAFGFGFLVVAFYSILFNSRSSLIKKEDISTIKIRKILFNTVLVVSHKESGRIKQRGIIITKTQVKTVKDALLSENLIVEKNINLNSNTFINRALFFIFLASISSSFFNIGEVKRSMFYNGTIVLIVSTALLINMIYRLMQPILNKKQVPN